MLYAGLKFTGLALSVAGDLAKSVRQDAERMAKELEADAAARVRLFFPASLCPGVMPCRVCTLQLHLAHSALLLCLGILQQDLFRFNVIKAPSLSASSSYTVAIPCLLVYKSQGCCKGKDEIKTMTGNRYSHAQHPLSVDMALTDAAYPALPAEAVQGERSSLCGPAKADSTTYHFTDQLR